MKCIAHRIGLDHECRTPGECDESNSDDPSVSGVIHNGAEPANPDADDNSDSADLSDDNSDIDSGHKTYKDDSALRDQQSTGRKRAARWFPLDETKLCEWSMKVNCGGGQNPITGCAANLQQARHHGPDKNTLNNEQGNVHRICHTCHNRWHTLNDEGYVWGDVQNAHQPKAATVEDIQKSEEFWEGRKLVHAKD